MSIYTDITKDARRAVCQTIFGKLTDEEYEALCDLRKAYERAGGKTSWEWISAMITLEDSD